MFKKFLFFFIISINVFSQEKEVIIKFNHLFKNDLIQSNVNFIYENTENTFNISFNRIEFYIHLISLNDNSGNSIYNFDNSSYLLVNKNEDTYSLGYKDVSYIDNISLNFGVGPNLNHEDPTIWELDHPLAPQNPSMHWGWTAGYIFLALEGYINDSLNFQYHSVSDEYYNMLNTFFITSETPNEIIFEININYDKMIENHNCSEIIENSCLNIHSGGNFHGYNYQNSIIMNNINLNDVFSQNNELLFSKILKSTPKIFPNPFNNCLNIKVQSPSTLKVYDFNSNLIIEKNLFLNHNFIDFSKLNSGNYMFLLTDKEDTKSINILKLD